MMGLTSLELCAGAGGQALGLEQAGFHHAGLVEIDKHACATLRENRPSWRVIEGDLSDTTVFRAEEFKGVDLVAGGLPCPPFSVAGKQLGRDDERNLFPTALEAIATIEPKAVMFENVRGFLDAAFHEYRMEIIANLEKMGYHTQFKLLNASDFGVPQLRPRVVIVALKNKFSDDFCWPEPLKQAAPTVGDALYDMMAEHGWRGANTWASRANTIAPTLVGGSKKHGGPDLGPTRARKAWEKLGVNGKTLAEEAPEPDYVGLPRLTVRMAARLQGFPDSWAITGRKTNAYRQVGNAFPPPISRAVGIELRNVLENRCARMTA